MNTKTNSEPKAPTANIAVNKSRVKLYNKTTTPTYYLQKGQEFEIELFNPTQDIILAKIILNNKPLSQGGLVLKPGERVFIERYLDVAKKFLFDTYEVSDSAEVQKAIEKNGDFKVQFFKEKTQTTITIGYYAIGLGNNTVTLGNGIPLGSPTTSTYNSTTIGSRTTTDTSSLSNSTTTTTGGYIGPQSTNVTMDWMVQDMERAIDEPTAKNITRGFAKKTVETGRVEKGSDSNQKIKQVQMDFEFFPFHTVEAKLLPISQKINTSKDLNVRQYCTNCGQKLSKGDKYCSKCGNKA